MKKRPLTWKLLKQNREREDDFKSASPEMVAIKAIKEPGVYFDQVAQGRGTVDEDNIVVLDRGVHLRVGVWYAFTFTVPSNPIYRQILTHAVLPTADVLERRRLYVENLYAKHVGPMKSPDNVEGVILGIGAPLGSLTQEVEDSLFAYWKKRLGRVRLF